MPTQNTYVERFNGNPGRELLNAYVFKTLSEVRQKVEEWVTDHNEHRPHIALNYKTPMELLHVLTLSFGGPVFREAYTSSWEQVHKKLLPRNFFARWLLPLWQSHEAWLGNCLISIVALECLMSVRKNRR